MIECDAAAAATGVAIEQPKWGWLDGRWTRAAKALRPVPEFPFWSEDAEPKAGIGIEFRPAVA